MMEKLTQFLEYEIVIQGDYKLKVSSIAIMFFTIAITKVALWFIKKGLFRKHSAKLVFDEGNTYALYKIIKYLVWVIAIAVLLDSAGIKITVLLAGSAALLVGIGLGLQQTFNDVVSGVLLLSERSIKIGDVLEIDGDVMRIHSIGLRTSKCLNRDDIHIIIPNSIITTSKVINWSHQSKKTRFRINVGVAYGSDVDLVIKVLEESALDHADIWDKNRVEARMVGFGNSSLDFELLFFSKNIFRIGKVKSDILRVVNRKFITNGIAIPFPQMDLHFKSSYKDTRNRNSSTEKFED